MTENQQNDPQESHPISDGIDHIANFFGKFERSVNKRIDDLRNDAGMQENLAHAKEGLKDRATKVGDAAKGAYNKLPEEVTTPLNKAASTTSDFLSEAKEKLSDAYRATIEEADVAFDRHFRDTDTEEFNEQMKNQKDTPAEAKTGCCKDEKDCDKVENCKLEADRITEMNDLNRSIYEMYEVLAGLGEPQLDADGDEIPDNLRSEILYSIKKLERKRDALKS